jgi:hypothetical protein
VIDVAAITDPLDALELVHAAAARLRELAGPAFVVTVAPASEVARDESRRPATGHRQADIDRSPPPSSTPGGTPGGASVATEAPPRRPRGATNRTAGREAEDLVRAYLRAHGGRGRQAAIADELGCERGRVRDALKRMAARGEARDTGEQERAPGITVGRASPIWELIDTGDVGEGADRRLATEDQPSAAPPGRPPSPERHDPDPGLERLTAAIHARKTDSAAEPETRADEPDSATQGETRDPTGAEVFGHPDGLNVSARTRKSIERAQAEERAAASLGDPPDSRVLDLLRDRAMSVHELAGALGESHALIAEELHALKPWTIELHDGKRRAVERLRRRAA